jgi:hypothetical protein
MPRSRLKYTLLAIGSNCSPDAAPLSFAASDVFRFTRAMTTPLSAVTDRILLTEEDATIENVNVLLSTIARDQPDYFCLYFAGHGNAAGIGLYDGLYSFAQLHGMLDEVGARSEVIVLDSCESQGFAKSAAVSGLGDIEQHFRNQLALSTPRRRGFMAARAGKGARESALVGGGVFTTALIHALLAAGRGDLANGRYVSDTLIMHRAKAYMKRHGLVPVSNDLTGDFPMIRAHVAPVGEAALNGASAIEGMGLHVEVELRARRHLPTLVIATPIGPGGEFGTSVRHVVVPQTDVAIVQPTFATGALSLPWLAQQWAAYGRCHVQWLVSVLDQHARSLLRQLVEVNYHTLEYR